MSWLRRRRIHLTIIGLSLGLLLTLFGLFGAALPASAVPGFLDGLYSGFDDFVDWLPGFMHGNWEMVALVVGVLLLVGFIWWLIDLITKHRKFNEIMAIESRNQFVKVQEEAEFIAWKLYGDYGARLAEKKRALRIKE